ncbi:MAG: hypothetical protein WD080_01500 [Egibacteraceae bacterium]
MGDTHDERSLHEVLNLGPTARHAQYEQYAIDELSTAYTTDGAIREWHLGRARVFASLAQAAAIADLRGVLGGGDQACGAPGG